MAPKKSRSIGERKSVSGSSGIKKSGPRTRKGGGSKLSRTEIVQVRLDPKLRFAAELAARKQRRTISSFIEWAVDEAVNKVIIPSTPGDFDACMITDEVWDVDEMERFLNLATNYDNLLAFNEQVLFKLILQKQDLWLTKKDLKAKRKLGYSGDGRGKIDFKILRHCFANFKEVANGDMEESELEDILKERQRETD